MKIQFGTIEGRIPYNKAEDEDSKTRDDLGLEKAIDFISDAIVPQTNTRFTNAAYIPYLLSAVNFASAQVRNYQANSKGTHRNLLRRRFLFWMDLFELCLAWTFKKGNEKSFVGVEILNNKFKNEDDFGAYLKSLKPRDVSNNLVFGDKFLTSRLSYVFDRMKYTLLILGFIEPMQNLPGIYRVSSPESVRLSPLYNKLKPTNTVLSPPEAYKSFYPYFKNLKLNNKTFGRKLWSEILFDSPNLEDLLQKHLARKEKVSYKQIIKNVKELKSRVEKERGEIFPRNVITQKEYKLTLNKVRPASKEFDLGLFLNFLRILNYYCVTPREILNEINEGAFKKIASLKWIERQGEKHSWARKSKEFYGRKNLAYFSSIAKIDYAFDDTIQFLRNFYNPKNKSRDLINVLGERVAKTKGFESGLYVISNNKVYFSSEIYENKFKDRKQVEPYYSRLGIIKNIYEQCHE